MKKIHNVAPDIRLLQILFIFILPVFLIVSGIIPSSVRIFVLLSSSMLMYGICFKEGWTYKDFGLRVDNIKRAFPAYLLFTIVGIFGISFLARSIGLSPAENWWTNAHFLYVFFIVSVLQEFAFRSFLIPILKDVFYNNLTIILVNAFCFMFIHIIYPLPVYGLPLAFIGGLWFATIYLKYPNLYLVTITHAILNFIAVLYGFFVII